MEYPTRQDRVAHAFFALLAVVPLLVLGMVFAAADDGLLPLLAVTAFHWPQVYVLYRLYRWRRQKDLRGQE